MTAHVIEVTPARVVGSNDITWTLCYKNINTCSGPPDYVPVELGEGKKNADQLFFISINDPSNLGVKFDAPLENALWIQADDKPTGPVLEPMSQILQATRVNDSILIFIDKNNGAKKTLKYQLNFVGRDNKEVTAIDPDIKNGGGKFLLFGVVEAVVAFLIGAAVALTITVMWFKKLGPFKKWA